jgi:hypothetical protein
MLLWHFTNNHIAVNDTIVASSPRRIVSPEKIQNKTLHIIIIIIDSVFRKRMVVTISKSEGAG